MTIRPARDDEYLHFARMRGMMAVEEGFDWDTDHPGWLERFARYFGEKRGRGDSEVFFAEVDGRVAGVAAVFVVDEYRVSVLSQPRGWVSSVFVLPEYRRRGIARSLMERGIAWLRERGCVKVRLRTSDDGEPLYRSMGFAPGRELEMEL